MEVAKGCSLVFDKSPKKIPNSMVSQVLRSCDKQPCTLIKVLGKKRLWSSQLAFTHHQSHLEAGEDTALPHLPGSRPPYLHGRPGPRTNVKPWRTRTPGMEHASSCGLAPNTSPSSNRDHRCALGVDIDLSWHPSTYLPIYLSTYLSIHPSIHPSIHRSIYQIYPIYLTI